MERMPRQNDSCGRAPCGQPGDPEGARTIQSNPPANFTQFALALQRCAGNSAVTQMLQRIPSSRLPTPSAAAAVPARIKGLQQEFHEAMREANEIMEGTKFHYDYVNGIYSENFKIHQVVLGQADLERLHNDKVVDALLAGAALAAKFAPQTAAASLVVQVWQIANKVEGVAAKVGKVLTIAAALKKPANKDGDDTKDLAPADPKEFRIVGLENVVQLMQQVATARDVGDAVLDAAVDLSTEIGTGAPDSGAITSEQSTALSDAASSCEELIKATQPLLTELRNLRKRREVRIPSWQEVEQDIWIAYFSHTGDTNSRLVYDHMVDIGLWGPPGQPGGRLGVADEIGGIMRYEGAKTIPGREDEETQQSIGPRTMSRTALVRAEAAALPAKWARIMLLHD